MVSLSNEPATGLIILEPHDTNASHLSSKAILNEAAAASKFCRKIYYDYFLGGENSEQGEKLIKTWQKALCPQSVSKRTADDKKSASTDPKNGKHIAWVAGKRFTISVAEISKYELEHKITESLCKPRPLSGRGVAYDFVDFRISATFASNSERPIISVEPLAKEYSPKAWWQTSLALQASLNSASWDDISVPSNWASYVTHSSEIITPWQLITRAVITQAAELIAKEGLNPAACVMEVSIVDSTTARLGSLSSTTKQNNMSAYSTFATPVTLQTVPNATSQAASKKIRRLKLRANLWQFEEPASKICCGSSNPDDQIYGNISVVKNGRPGLTERDITSIYKKVNDTVNRTWRKSVVLANSINTNLSFHEQLKAEYKELLRSILDSHGVRAGEWSCEFSVERVKNPSLRTRRLATRTSKL